MFLDIVFSNKGFDHIVYEQTTSILLKLTSAWEAPRSVRRVVICGRNSTKKQTNNQTRKKERGRNEKEISETKLNFMRYLSKKIEVTVNAEFAYNLLFTVKMSSVTDEVHLLLYRLLFPSFCG